MILRLLIFITVIAVTACDVEEEKSPALCTRIENSRIEANGTGVRDVTSIQSGSMEKIGYMRNGALVAHSECSAAYIDNSNDKYSWFEFGNKVENDGVHSIQYYTNASGQPSSKAERLEREGRWQVQYVENGVVTKQTWNNQALFDQIVVVGNFDGSDIREVVVKNGKLTKTKRFNINTVQYDCFWNNNGSITSDIGCLSESTNDTAIFGINVNSDFYLEQLNKAEITYELDVNELVKDIRRYW